MLLPELVLIWLLMRSMWFYFSQHRKDSLRVTLRVWDSQGKHKGHWLRVHLRFCESCGRFSAMQKSTHLEFILLRWKFGRFGPFPLCRCFACAALCCNGQRGLVPGWKIINYAAATVTLDCWLGILFALHDTWIVNIQVSNHINVTVWFLVAVQVFELQELYDMHNEVKQHSGAMIAIVTGPRSNA